MFNIYIYERIGFFIGNKKILALKVFKTMTKQVHTKYTNKAQKKLVCKEEKRKKKNLSLTWQITNLENQSKMCDPLYTP